MAISKIHPIRKSVLSAINYITNPDKTNDSILVSSYACSIQTADLEFAQTASKGSKIGDVKAQHIIQAFAPGEVDANTAHEIGKRLAMEVTDGKYEFVIATHVDKDHVHNHIIFNQTDFIDHKKYRGNIACQKQIAKINDTLCASYGLSVISNNKDSKAKSYYDYKSLKTNSSNRQSFKIAIDACIPLASSFDELLIMLQKLGFEYKESNGNYSFKKDSWQRFVRLKTMGENYSYSSICLRIDNKSSSVSSMFKPAQNEFGLLSELREKLDNVKNPYYKNKIAVAEVKRIGATYAFLNTHGLLSRRSINEKLDEWSASVKEKHSQIKSLESQINDLSFTCELLKNREDNNKFYAAYLKSGKDPKVREKYLTEIMLFESAAKQLALNNISPDSTYSDYKSKLDDLVAKKDALLASYHEESANLKQLNIAAKNIDLIMGSKDNELKKNKGKDVNL